MIKMFMKPTDNFNPSQILRDAANAIGNPIQDALANAPAPVSRATLEAESREYWAIKKRESKALLDDAIEARLAYSNRMQNA